jgi:hypothetical protein
MTWDTGSGPAPYASATYTGAGQLAELEYAGHTETRNYTTMMQLHHQTTAVQNRTGL